MKVLLYKMDSNCIETIVCHSVEISDREHDRTIEFAKYEDGSLTLEKYPLYGTMKIEILL